MSCTLVTLKYNWWLFLSFCVDLLAVIPYGGGGFGGGRLGGSELPVHCTAGFHLCAFSKEEYHAMFKKLFLFLPVPTALGISFCALSSLGSRRLPTPLLLGFLPLTTPTDVNFFVAVWVVTQRFLPVTQEGNKAISDFLLPLFQNGSFQMQIKHIFFVWMVLY